VVVDCLAANAAGVPLRDHEQRRRHVDAEGLGGLEVTTNSSLVSVRFGRPRNLRRTDANKPFCDVDATAIGRVLYAGRILYAGVIR
jgi:hypothetical protein